MADQKWKPVSAKERVVFEVKDAKWKKVAGKEWIQKTSYVLTKVKRKLEVHEA